MNTPACDACGGVTSVETACVALREDGPVEPADLPYIQSVKEFLSTPLSESCFWGHVECVPSTHSYVIAAQRLDSHGKILDWTLHLVEKSWLDAGSWGEIVRRLHPDIPDA